ncbi:MAG: hypothetical protein ACI9MR_000367, partial [Myxococcota bacterium]
MTATADATTVPVELFIKKEGRRVCRGDLVFTDAAMYFICREDLNVWKANRGGQGTGLLGVAIGSAIGAAIEKREGGAGETTQPSIEESLEAQLGHNKYSFKAEPGGIGRFGSSLFTGRLVEVGSDKYLFRKIAKDDIVKVKAWCDAHKV